MTIARRDLLLGAGAVALAPHVSAKSDGEAGQRFLWGAATAAHQIEGNNINSDYWVLEHVPDTYFKEASGDACDSWSRWREDLALVKAAGLNAYRFSVEWARVEPEPGVYSPAMIAHYRAIFMACRAANIEPVVTFHHFTSPRWIAAAGGWENPDTADRFARYCAMMAAAFGPTLRWACTMNEPNAQVTSFILGGGRAWPKHPDFRAQAAKAVGSDRFGAYFIGDAMRVRDVCIDAHRKSRDAIKLVAPRAKVGLTLALQDLAAGPGGEALYRRIYDEARAPFYAVARDDDFIGVQSYFRLRTAVAGYHPPDEGIERDASGLAAPTDVLTATIAEAHRATGVPVLISENGINTVDDAQRVRHLDASITTMAQSIERGAPVLGYIHWSLLDNFEWSSGYTPRYGLVAVDRTTFVRTPKPSLMAYRAIIAATRKRYRWA